jgi:ketosteroid isomerase-like protein
MLTSSKQEMVRRLMEAWGRNEVDSTLELLHPEVVLDWSRSISPFRGVYRGHAGVREYWAASWEAWATFKPRIEEAIDCGPDQLITVNRVRARGEASGLEISARGAALWTFCDGLIIGFTLFQDRDDALAAVRGHGAEAS